jgi:hypothetical protein
MPFPKGLTHRSVLGGYTLGKKGVVINPKVPRVWRGIKMRSRLKAHEFIEKKEREAGTKYKPAHNKGLKEEHRGLTQKQISQYEGKLGSIAARYRGKNGYPKMKRFMR